MTLCLAKKRKTENVVAPAVLASTYNTEATLGPNGPDGKPLFELLPEFVAVYLVFASDVLVRIGELDTSVFDHYFQRLHSLNPSMAEAYKTTNHCTVYFLTDATTMKLIKKHLADCNEISDLSL